MSIKLNIYKSDTETVCKVYEVKRTCIKYGMAEDLIKFIGDSFSRFSIENLNDLNDINKIASLITDSFDIVEKFVKGTIPEISSEELKSTRLDELIEFIYELIKYSLSGIIKVFSKLPKKK